jgi:type IV secretory pathway TrbD component
MKTLELNQMENLQGGGDCDELALGLGGAAAIIGFSAWWTGFGAGISLAVATASYLVTLACADQ